MTKQNIILSEEKIFKILKRIAVEIVENNFDSKNVVLVGITNQGYKMAQRLKKEISKSRWSVNCSLQKLEIDKSDPVSGEVKLDCDPAVLHGKTVVVVDDVMNTGRTQAYALSYILKASVKKVETAVLVNRSHTAFPIHVTYSGIELNTTIDDHIEVKLEKEVGAYLY